MNLATPQVLAPDHPRMGKVLSADAARKLLLAAMQDWADSTRGESQLQELQGPLSPTAHRC